MFSFKDDTFKDMFLKKYDIAQQEANSGTTSSNAQMMNAQTARSGMPSEIALRQAQARNFNVTSDLMPAESAALVRNRDANSGLLIEQTRGARIENTPASLGARRVQSYLQGLPYEEDIAPISGGMMRPQSLADRYTTPQSFIDAAGYAENDPRRFLEAAKGLTKVPGKGSGKVDTVKAKLAPGEAVLNKAAAEMMGRGLIAKLNAKGAAKMGMV